MADTTTNNKITIVNKKNNMKEQTIKNRRVIKTIRQLQYTYKITKIISMEYFYLSDEDNVPVKPFKEDIINVTINESPVTHIDTNVNITDDGGSGGSGGGRGSK